MRAHVACLLFALTACGKVEGGITDAAPIDTLTNDTPPQPHWTQIASVTATLDFGNNRGFVAVGLGASIYFAPIYDTERSQFHAFDTTTLQVSADLAVPPGTQNDFQASGFGAIFVADASSVYLIGDEAQRFDPETGRWATVGGYGPATSFMRGESDGAWDTSSDTIFMVGGRDRATNQDQGTAIRHNTDGTWADEPGALPYTVSSGLAYGLPNENRIFVAGGRASDNNRKHLAVHSTGTSGWTALADAPGDLGSPIGIGHFTSGGLTRLWVASDAKVYFYNPQSMTWDRSIDLPATGLTRIVMVAGVPHAMVQNGTMADVYKLVAID